MIRHIIDMKKFLPAALLALLLLPGCANRYRITLNNGNVIDTRTKPRLDASGMTYHFKDATGREMQVTAIRIREIAPR
jgi:hypothetical protein